MQTGAEFMERATWNRLIITHGDAQNVAAAAGYSDDEARGQAELSSYPG